MSRPYPYTCASTCPCRTVTADPTCLCGFTRCDKGPYCEVVRLAERAVVSSKATGGPGLSESDALLAAFDKMAEFHRAEAARRAGIPSDATPGTTVASSKAASARGSRGPSKKELRLRKAEREGRAITPGWLADQSDPLLDSILKSEET